MSLPMTQAEIDAHNARVARGKRVDDALIVAIAPVAHLAIVPSTEVSKLNKTERAYHQYLVCMNYQWLGVQNITLKLADDCRLTPDFAYLDKDGHLVMIDVKGFQREDALIKMKVAARMFPWIRFVIVKRNPNGGWAHNEVNQ